MAFADRMKIIVASSLLFVVALMLSRYLSRRFVRPISDAVDALKADGSIGDGLTGFSEIDALVSVLDSKAASIKPSLLPPDVASLLDEFSARFATLTATERISIHTARKHNANIYRKLNVGSREELVLYLELFRRCKKLDALFGEGGVSQNPEA